MKMSEKLCRNCDEILQVGSFRRRNKWEWYGLYSISYIRNLDRSCTVWVRRLIITRSETETIRCLGDMNVLLAGAAKNKPLQLFLVVLAVVWNFIAKFYNVAYVPVRWVEKIQDTLLLSITSPNIDQFSKFFHQQTQISDCVTNWWLKIPSHLKRDATLPCGTIVFRKNWPN